MKANGLFTFDGRELKPLILKSKRIPVGTWTKASGVWEQLRLIPRQATRKYDWVDVPVGQMPKALRVHLLLLGLS